MCERVVSLTGVSIAVRNGGQVANPHGVDMCVAQELLQLRPLVAAERVARQWRQQTERGRRAVGVALS